MKSSIQSRSSLRNAAFVTLALASLLGAAACRREESVGTTTVTSAPSPTVAEEPAPPGGVPTTTAPPASDSMGVGATGNLYGSDPVGDTRGNWGPAGIGGGFGPGSSPPAETITPASQPPPSETSAGVTSTTSAETTTAQADESKARASYLRDPLVRRCLDNVSAGGVTTSADADQNTSTTDRPTGGPMRPGAASNPDTTSGAR